MSAKGIKILSGGAVVSSATTISKYKILDGYTMIAGSRGRATSTTVASGGILIVDGGSLSKTAVASGGRMSVYSGTFTDTTSIRNSGYVEILGSGEKFSIVNGSMTVASGATASEVSLFLGATATVLSGGKLIDMNVVNGTLSLSPGGTATSTVISKGTMTIADGAEAFGVSQHQSGAVVQILSGGRAYNLINEGTETIVSSGGVVSNTSLCHYASSGGESTSTTTYYGHMLLESGALHQGTMTLTSSTVTAEEGSVIDLTMVKVQPNNKALISDYSYIQGNPTYTMTVNFTQSNGTYYLADNAKTFDKTIRVITQSSEPVDDRMLSVDETIACNNKFYTLSINTGKSLILTIVERFTVKENKTLTMKENIVQSGRPEAYAGSGGAVEVQSGGLLNNSGAIVFAGCSATGDGGAVLNGGTVTFDQVTFSNCVANKQGGAVYNKEGAIVNVAGKITLATDSDTIVNNGTMNWALTGGSAGNTDFAISSWNLVSGSGVYTVTVDAVNKQYGGNYVLAENVDHTFSITLKCGGTELKTLTVDSSHTSADCIASNGGYYVLSLNQSNEAILSVRSLCFYNESADPAKAWKEGDAVSCTFQGTEITGTVGDGTFFVNADAAKSVITAQDSYGVAVERDYTKSTSGGGMNTVIAEGTYSKMYFGGSISTADASFDGAYEQRIIGGNFQNSIAAGDAVNGICKIERDGDIYLNIEGGTFDKRVAGGMYFGKNKEDGSAALYGNVNFSISGGTFNGRIYGGCNAKNGDVGEAAQINGNVTVTVTTDSTHCVAINECLVAGSRGTGIITGSVTVTFTGIGGDNLKFGESSIVYGGCNSDFVKIDSEGKTISSSVGKNNKAEYRNLVFTDFSGGFDAEIKMFGTISFKNNSQVTFTDEKLDLWSIEIWNFEFGSSASGVTANEFDGDILKFDMTGCDGQDWNVLSGSADAFKDLAEAGEVWFGTSQAEYKEDCWTDGTYKLALNDDKNGMILSKIEQS